MGVTYSRALWEASVEAWNTGGFGEEWKIIRHIAANNGFCFPPPGTAHDDPDHPSWRSIVYRAITDNPTETEQIVRDSSNWSMVVDAIFKMNLRLASDAADREADAEAQRSRDKGDAAGRAGQGQGVPRAKARPVAVGDLLGTINLGSHPGVPDDGETGSV